MKRILHIVTGILLLSSYGCTKEIEIDLDEGDRKLVVDAWFTTEQTVHEIRLTQTADYFSNETVPLVSGATVQISGGGQLFPFSETTPGIYQSAPTAKAELGNEYTLSITYDGQIYEATDYCDTVPTLDFVDLFFNADPDGDWYDILIWTTELSGYGHYYCWRLLKNGEYLKDTLSEIYFEADEYLGDGLNFEAYPIEWIYADEVNSGDTLTLEQHNISKQTYDAFIAILSETEWRGGIFDAPPANIQSNVSNGGLGLFIVSPMVTMDVIVP